VCGAIASNAQMERIVDFTISIRLDRVAGLVCRSGDLETRTSELQHLGHERHVIDCAVVVERPQDFFGAKNFNPVTNPIRHTNSAQIAACPML
jgi:hypothetical protein